jgi:hypothetical protein
MIRKHFDLESVEIFSRQILICSQRICNMARALHCEDTSEICPILYSTFFRSLKGLVQQINFVLRPIKLNQYFVSMRRWFYTFLECLLEEKSKLKNFACFSENPY